MMSDFNICDLRKKSGGHVYLQLSNLRPIRLQTLYAYNGGLLRGPVRRILKLAGWSPKPGWPGREGVIGVWGASPTAWRGLRIAALRGKGEPAGLLRVEDAFLRSVLPARLARGRQVPAGWRQMARRAPMGLVLDPYGIHFDPSRPNLFETLIMTEVPQITRARAGIAFLRQHGLTKYSHHLPAAPLPPEGSVLVIDQTRNDASLMGAGRDAFLAMLAAARVENPGCQIVIRGHPETAAGLRAGHLGPEDLHKGEVFHDAPADPWQMLGRARKVYAISSQLGYEAILAGHRPRIFGLPFYAGWGLSDDEHPLPRSGRGKAEVEALFTASHLLGPIWYDPCHDRLCDFETAAHQLAAEARAWRQDHAGHRAYGMRLWKRRHLVAAFGNGRGVAFTDQAQPTPSLAWAGAWLGDSMDRPESGQPTLVEDGFIRSRGLGAALTPPLSLVADQHGIYYDPRRESDLEALITTPLTSAETARAEALIARLCREKLGKYNLGGGLPGGIPEGSDQRKIILVPGQVADDASVRFGATGKVRDNASLLAAVRAKNPTAFIIYKPHPDIEAGLRDGAIPAHEADLIAHEADPLALLERVDAVWTLTSTLGFEALIRGVPVTCLGAPFYAGWGLTQDLAPTPERRQARPDLAGLVHAALIAYPRYHDPVSGLPCPVEVALDRLETGMTALPPGLRILSKLQGLLASQSWLWRQGPEVQEPDGRGRQ